MAPRTSNKFNSTLQNDYPFLKCADNCDSRVQCSHCGGDFSIANGGRTDIKKHINSNKHKQKVSAALITNKITNFIPKTEINKGDLDLASNECTFAYHTVQHSQSFKSCDCTSKLIKKFYDKKFSSGHKKTQAIFPSTISTLHK